MQVNDLPNFAVARLCFLKILAVRPAHPAKVISDLLDSSLQSVSFDVGGENHTNARI